MSAGSVKSLATGDKVAPFVVRIVYGGRSGYEVKESTVQCHIDARGTVVALA